jgi:hypothetical protein
VDGVAEEGVAVVAVAVVAECEVAGVGDELVAAVEVIAEVDTAEAAVHRRCRDHPAGHHR